MAKRLSKELLREWRADIKRRLQNNEKVSAAEKRAAGYGGWSRYFRTSEQQGNQDLTEEETQTSSQETPMQAAPPSSLVEFMQTGRANLRPAGMSLQQYFEKTEQRQTVKPMNPVTFMRSTPEQQIFSGIGYRLDYVAAPRKTQPYLGNNIGISKAFEGRIDRLLKREARLDEFKSNIYKSARIDVKASDPFLLQTAKLAAQQPIELASAPVFIGGRAAFAAEALTTKAGRSESLRAAKATPSAVIQSFNPTKPQGLVNIGMAAIAIHSTAKAFRSSAPKIELSTSATKRITMPDITKDFSRMRIQATSGSKSVTLTAKGSQMYIRTPEGSFLQKGRAVIETPAGKKAYIDIRGVAIPKQGGFDVTSLIRSKGKKFIITTKTAEIVNKPQSFIELSTTLKGEQKIWGFKPRSIGAGVTKEIYIEDIFRPDENIFRKTVKGESGKPIGTEQFLGSERLSADIKGFEKVFTSAKPRTAARYSFEESGTGRITMLESKSGSLKTKGAAVIETKLPTLESALREGSRIMLKDMPKTSPTVGSILKSGMSLAGTTISPHRAAARSYPSVSSMITIRPPVIKPIIGALPVTQPTPAISSQPIITLPKITTQPTLRTVPVSRPVRLMALPVLPSISSFTSRPVSSIPRIFTPANISAPSIPVTPIGLPAISLERRRKKGKAAKLTGQASRYKPSLAGIGLNIRTPSLKRSVLTGWELRGL